MLLVEYWFQGLEGKALWDKQKEADAALWEDWSEWESMDGLPLPPKPMPGASSPTVNTKGCSRYGLSVWQQGRCFDLHLPLCLLTPQFLRLFTKYEQPIPRYKSNPLRTVYLPLYDWQILLAQLPRLRREIIGRPEPVAELPAPAPIAPAKKMTIAELLEASRSGTLSLQLEAEHLYNEEQRRKKILARNSLDEMQAAREKVLDERDRRIIKNTADLDGYAAKIEHLWLTTLVSRNIKRPGNMFSGTFMCRFIEDNWERVCRYGNKTKFSDKQKALIDDFCADMGGDKNELCRL